MSTLSLESVNRTDALAIFIQGPIGYDIIINAIR